MVRHGGFFSHARGASRARLAEILLNLLAAKPFRGEYLSLKMACQCSPCVHHVDPCGSTCRLQLAVTVKNILED